MGKRKVTQEHIDLLEKLVPDIISGEKNAKEVCEIVNQMSREKELPQISPYSIRKYARIILKDKPEELAKLSYAMVHNNGKNFGNKIIEESLKNKIINEDLKLILDRKVQITDIAKKRGISIRSTRDIIENYLNKDEEKFAEYKAIVKKNMGASTKRRISSKAKKSRVESTEIVSNKNFELLSKEEKRKQLVYKFLKMKMNEKEDAQISNEEAVDNRIQELIEFFESRNQEIDEKKNINEEDALNMMYKVPTLLNYSIKEKIEPVLQTLGENEKIGYENANVMVKQFPSIFGYSPERTAKQLEILGNNNLMDAVIDSPRRLMESPQLMYAQIEYAKERHHTQDLSMINRSNIFASNSTLMRLYGTNYDEIKERFSLKENTKEDTIRFTEQEIGKETARTSTELKDKTQQVIDNRLREKSLNKDENQI